MYVDARFDRKSDQIQVVERVNGKRVYKEYQARYTFYYEDPKGKFRSIYKEPVTRVVCKNTTSFKKEKALKSGKKLYESDINPINQCLAEYYLNTESPKLNVCFWDIETDFEKFLYPRNYKIKLKRPVGEDVITVGELVELSATSSAKNCKVWDEKSNKWVPISGCIYLKAGRGFSPPHDPFMPITAVSLYLDWLDKMVTLAIIPPTMTMDQAKKEVEGLGEHVYLYTEEKDLLLAFLDTIEDVDVLSGWNCSTFDIPYVINRITKVLSKHDTRKMCLWNQFPKSRTFERFGKEQKTYDLTGRVNLDYLDLYKKYTYEERTSYKLDSIGEIELGERKTEYEGTLDQLYHGDFKLFLTYNIQDVNLLHQLDKKFEYIELTTASAHENTVLMPATLGSVAIIEQGIINEAHLHGMVIPDKHISEDDSVSIAGGYVGVPRKGIHEWIGSIDLNSLYPSIIRSLNMGNETVVGQIRQDRTSKMIQDFLDKGYKYSHAWEEKFSCIEYNIVMDKRNDETVIIDWERGNSIELSGAQAYNLLFNSNKKWMLSANGTIFSCEQRGIIPDLLTKWYNDRKVMQKQKKNWQRLNDGIKLPERFVQ